MKKFSYLRIMNTKIFQSIFSFTFLISLLASAAPEADKPKLPNIILIMADDMGHECVSSNGSESYKTPHLDAIAAQGVRFTNCFANPLCTPSRVKIMTGMSNVRNYVKFGSLDRGQKTFAHYLKEAGYKTCITGKWQLEKEPDSAQHFGFDQSFLWQHTRPKNREGSKIDSRHVNPRFEINGVPKDFDNGEFSSDLCVEFIDTFMTKHKGGPFFIYYPMILPHCPFVPTPSSADFDKTSLGCATYNGDVKYFKNMVEYVDLTVGKIDKRISELGIADHTILIFTGDNGTDRPVVTNWNGTTVAGAKGTMTDAGTRVPLIIKFPGKTKQGIVTNQMVDFSDFLPTFCELGGIKLPSQLTDGESLIPILKGENREKQFIYIWYEQSHGNAKKATVMARTQNHQLLRKGRNGTLDLFNCTKPYAIEKILPENYTAQDKHAFDQLSKIISAKDKLFQSALNR